MEVKYLKVGAILLLIILIIIVLFKFLPSKPPPTLLPSEKTIEKLSPEEVVIKYLSLEQQEKREEAKKYLSSDFSKVEIFGEKYPDLSLVLWGIWKGPVPEYQIKEIETLDDESEVVLKVRTQRIESKKKGGEYSTFFIFKNPKEIFFDATLIKEGKDWKIRKIDLPELILERKLGEKVEITKNVFIKPDRIEDYPVKIIKLKPKKGFKFVSLSVQYENLNNEGTGNYFYVFRDWKIIDEEKRVYNPVFNPSNPVEFPPPIPKLEPKEIKTVNVFFEIPENTKLKELIFQNLDKKVIFKID
jgi:hypothetical protein